MSRNCNQCLASQHWCGIQQLNDPKKCQSAQNFCIRWEMAGPYLEDSPYKELGLNSNDLFRNKEINAEMIQTIKKFLQQIHDAGKYGTRSPDQKKIDAIRVPEKDELIVKSHIEPIFEALEKNIDDYIGDGPHERIKSQGDQIGLAIAQYPLDWNRCNTCNASANCSEYTPPPKPTSSTICYFLQFISSGGGGGCSQGSSGDGCPCGGQCLMSEGAASPCTICEGCNTYSMN